MRGAAHFRFTVDRHHPLAPNRNGCRDPVRPAKNVITGHQHRKAVNLPDLFTFGFHPYYIFFYYLLYALFDKVGAIDTLFCRLVDVLPLNNFAALDAGKVIGFSKKVRDGPKLEGELIPVLGKLHTVFEHTGDSRFVQVPYMVVVAVAGDHPRAFEDLARLSVHLVAHVGLDLEEFLEALVKAVEQLVDIGVPGKHYLWIKRNGLGPDR